VRRSIRGPEEAPRGHVRSRDSPSSLFRVLPIPPACALYPLAALRESGRPAPSSYTTVVDASVFAFCRLAHDVDGRQQKHSTGSGCVWGKERRRREGEVSVILHACTGTANAWRVACGAIRVEWNKRSRQVASGREGAPRCGVRASALSGHSSRWREWGGGGGGGDLYVLYLLLSLFQFSLMHALLHA